MWDFVNILALIWVMYIFLFAESDKEVAELFARLKHSLAINEEGAFDSIQFGARQAMGIIEVIESKSVIDPNHFRYKNITKFANKYNAITTFKKVLIANLLFLTVTTTLATFLPYCSYWNVFHIVISLILGVVFYIYILKLSEPRFTRTVLGKW